MESQLHSYLTTNSTGNAIYSLFIPETGTLPCVVFQRISDSRLITMSGPSHLVDARFQLTLWHTSYGNAKTSAEALITLLDGFHSTMGTTTIQYIELVSQTDVYESEADNQIQARYGVRLEFVISYNE